MPRPSRSLLAVVTLAAALAVLPRASDAIASPAVAADEPVEPLDLDGLRGKVVVVELMETWCPACRSTVPTLNRWHERGAARGLHVVIASPESAQALRRYRDAEGLLAHAAMDPGSALARRFEVDAYPTFVVLDRDGNLRGRFRGAGPGLANVEAAFSALLDGEPAPGSVRFGARSPLP